MIELTVVQYGLLCFFLLVAGVACGMVIQGLHSIGRDC